MVFISNFEKYFAYLLIGDLLCKFEFLPDYSFELLGPFTVVIALGAFNGTIRPHILLWYVIHLVNYLIQANLGGSYTMSWVITVIESIVAVILVNAGMFYYAYPSGPYGVGHRDTSLKGETTPEVSIFYPTFELTYKNHRSNEQKTSPFLLNGMKDIEGICKGYEGVPPFAMKDFCLYRLKAVNDASLHSEFEKKEKMLTPVIISHDLMHNRTSLASLAYQLASYGCIVYCINHSDGTATYHINSSKGGKREVFYQPYDKTKHNVTMGKYRSAQIEHRMKDIQGLLKFIQGEAEELNIDMTKLVAVGFGMGGMTSIEMAKELEEVKLCVALDPYYSARSEQILASEYSISKPYLIVTNEDYPDSPFNADYEHKKVNTKFVEESGKGDGNYNLTMKDASHICSADISLYYSPVFKFIGLMHPIIDIMSHITKSRDLVTAFLEEQEVLPVKFGQKVKKINKK